MSGIELKEVHKVYPGGTHAVRGLSLEIAQGELMVLLGPSGCGKSTVLRLVAGLEPLTDGEIRIGRRRVDQEPPDRRDVAMVFQSYALYGHMTVRENIEFPLRMRGVAAAERRRRAEETAAMLELTALLDARPGALSGGQQQRVAMGRALVRAPSAFLLDEPLSNLDARLRTQVREEIARVQARLGVTTLHVTHDQVEALSLGHRVAVMRDGRLEQVGRGQELYDRPATAFVARFLGQPGMNLVRGRWVERSEGVPGQAPAPPVGSVLLDGTDVRIPVPAEALGGGPAPDGDATVLIGVRPEDVDLADTGAGHLPATVRTVEELGRERIVHLATPTPALADPGGESASEEVLFAVRTDRRRRVPEAGERLQLAPRPERIRLFTAEGIAWERRAIHPST